MHTPRIPDSYLKILDHIIDVSKTLELGLTFMDKEYWEHEEKYPYVAMVFCYLHMHIWIRVFQVQDQFYLQEKPTFDPYHESRIPDNGEVFDTEVYPPATSEFIANHFTQQIAIRILNTINQ